MNYGPVSIQPDMTTEEITQDPALSEGQACQSFLSRNCLQRKIVFITTFTMILII